MELETVSTEEKHYEVHESAHPRARTYIEIAVVLAVITIIEVAIFYVPAEEGLGIASFRPFLIPSFLVLSAVKFVLVVGFYMHLKFDDVFFTRVFGFALIIALTIATAIIALFHGVYF